MKAVSPLRSRPGGGGGGGGGGGLLPGRFATIRSKSPVLPQEAEEEAEEVLLLADMERCYRLLRAMVPGLPADRSLSRLDVLQHVIDYILDLETALEPRGAPTHDPAAPPRTSATPSPPR
ncbi:hypothetical protein NHX12_026483 [Muraenolepis orangiensis]|uniref:BHLH domain-containing protein n=1 Tax=Muraenolepis orangiensis TaxID=630683 RepID=A0A9Q0EF85_9TELE|nr:hypothetical protein NHX12_026483 [Muraenolepis orangiensis]